MRKNLLLVATIILISLTTFAQKSFKNPAAAYCQFLGYNYSVKADKQGNDVGICTLPNGQQVNAWDFYKGKVAQEFSYAAKKGYSIQSVVEKADGFTVEKAVCTKSNKGIQESLTLEELMAKNGDQLQLDSRGPQADAYDVAKENPNFVMAKSTPTSFDWRSYNSHSYIGAVRDQGSCGSCYAFGATACAEGTYNYAMGLYDSNTSDFAESYIVWCLGSMSAYSGNFGGCDGADYTYSELQALCDIGTIPETVFPYSESTGQSCPSAATSATKTKFNAWYRVTCSDIDAIKTAIMTYGVVDAAVYVTTAFQNYTSGIYTDSYTTCSSSPCYNTPTNHAIALVGWGYDSTYGDYWILRNSWGSSWGESGYMRIKATSARVACEVCYLTYASVTPTVPTATTVAASGISTTSATLNATVNANNASTTVTFEYGTSTSYGSTVSGTPSTVTGTTATSVTAALTGLTANTTYNYRVKAVNFVGTTYGSNMTFTTSSTPTSLTLPVTENFASSSLPTNWTTQNTGTSITERWGMSNTANAGGAAYELKCSYQNVSPATTRIITPAVNTVGVSSVTFSFKHMLDAYSTGVTLKLQTSNDKSTWTDAGWSVATSSTNIAAATVNVTVTTNLNSATTYFALVADGNLYNIDYWYIDNISITSGSSTTTPTVTTTAASSITSSTATSGGNVTADGGATVTERGICYATTANPTTSNSRVASGTGTGTFTANMTGLAASTTYYVRAYAINSNGTAYGSQVSFTTLTDGGTTDVTIGTGTSVQGFPLNCYYGYERSASIYTLAEIGSAGSISKLAWYSTVTTSYSVPVKIYIKQTTATTITSSTWATLTSGATLVYSGTMAGTTASAWKEFSLTTAFSYTGGTNNLMVLVETNYTGTGAGNSTGPGIRYTSATSKHMYVRADNSAPTGKGTVTSYRPNIKLTIAKSSTKNDNLEQNEVIISDAVTAYPNPTTGIVTVKSEKGIKSISVFSITGAKIYSNTDIKDEASKEIDLSNFNSGIYIIVVNDGVKNHSIKVSKQ